MLARVLTGGAPPPPPFPHTHSYLMTCDTPGSDVWTEGGGLPHGGPGLVKGHAYTLLSVKNTSAGVKLLNIRNPWGRCVPQFWEGCAG